MLKFTCLGSSTKAAAWKMPRPFVKKIYLVILKHILEGQEPIGMLSGDIGTDGHPVCFSFYLLTSAWQTHFLPSASDLLALEWWGGCQASETFLWPHQSWPSKCLTPVPLLQSLQSELGGCLQSCQAWLGKYPALARLLWPSPKAGRHTQVTVGTPTEWFTLVARSFIFLGSRGLKNQKVLDTLKNWHLSRKKSGCLETDSQT